MIIISTYYKYRINFSEETAPLLYIFLHYASSFKSKLGERKCWLASLWKQSIRSVCGSFYTWFSSWFTQWTSGMWFQLCLIFSICRIGNMLTFIRPSGPIEGSLTKLQHWCRCKAHCWITMISTGVGWWQAGHQHYFCLLSICTQAPPCLKPRCTFQLWCSLPGLKLGKLVPAAVW